MLGAPVRQFLVGHDGVCRAAAADGGADGVGRAGRAVRAFDGGGVDFGEVFDAFARAGGEDGCGDGQECDAVQVFFHNAVLKVV